MNHQPKSPSKPRTETIKASPEPKALPALKDAVNAKAIAAYNQHVEEHGLLLESYRNF